MVVHTIETELSVIELWHKPAESNAELAAIAGLFVFGRPYDVGSGTKRCCSNRRALRVVFAVPDQTVDAVTANSIGGEESTAVISNGAVPLELIEGLHCEVFCQALRKVEHLNRKQAFFQLSTRAAERLRIDRVDRVNTILDEDTLTPADDLTAETNVTRVIADKVVVVKKGI